MKAISTSSEVLTFSDLVDTDAVRVMMEDFYAATGFVVGIVDRDGKIAVQVGYRDICTRFHRACGETERRCIASDTHINNRLQQGAFVDYTCANGLIDAASPIIIDGEHLATIYTGQFFFDPPDRAFFEEQARRFDFDRDSYMAALDQVPVVSRAQYESVMRFLTRFAELLAELGLQGKRRRLIEAAIRQADKMEAVGRLAGGVAHDLNNMLQVILGHGEIAQLRSARGLDTSRPLEKVMEAANRAQGLVTQLLAFGRRPEATRKLIDLGETVTELMSLVKRLIGSHIEIELDLDPDAPPVLADPSQLEQVVMNLCVNARDAMPDGGRIVVSVWPAELGHDQRHQHPEVEAPDGLVVLEVRDTGRGIPEEHLEHIFEPFFTTKGPDQGTGLGLATVYAIVEQHGGFIDVVNRREGGAAFSVSLPAADGRIAPFEDLEPTSGAWVGGHEAILVAEDERLVREFSCQILEAAGYRVLAACDGAEAVELFTSHIDEIDMLILDVIMPEMNGREVYEAVRRLRPEIPVLFCSAYSRDLLANDYTLELPAGRLLQKPYTPRDLLRYIRELLATRNGASDIGE
ncbi:MAG: PocR ligand-binding domain-containing protein [Thermoanaerobaculales bacterium]|jgi:signal transduction histidine kinase/CheY-like chemotaxis protein|nr:PocR ligand-binding domain-containing protein [Thermoanaerobaculales bacterium]